MFPKCRERVSPTLIAPNLVPDKQWVLNKFLAHILHNKNKLSLQMQEAMCLQSLSSFLVTIHYCTLSRISVLPQSIFSSDLRRCLWNSVYQGIAYCTLSIFPNSQHQSSVTVISYFLLLLSFFQLPGQKLDAGSICSLILNFRIFVSQQNLNFHFSSW